MSQLLEFVFEKAENIGAKAENASYQHFLLFPTCVQKAFASESLNVGFFVKDEMVSNCILTQALFMGITLGLACQCQDN